MSKMFWQRLFSATLLLGMVFSFVQPMDTLASPAVDKDNPPDNPKTQFLTPLVITSTRSDVSPELRSISPAPEGQLTVERPNFVMPKALQSVGMETHDPSIALFLARFYSNKLKDVGKARTWFTKTA